MNGTRKAAVVLAALFALVGGSLAVPQPAFASTCSAWAEQWHFYERLAQDPALRSWALAQLEIIRPIMVAQNCLVPPLPFEFGGLN
ncbi:hypothetical protein [Micromonospora lutea]|uniref:Uncharacterized protein n=1 Tax=Micromonospora lutea TaxID=419825 RepID=A0ABQ4J0H7_9ACTN|nr:hypothetical protein [Micromonospora lutea]GIJ23597.1 hypothetical protein Vlu01_42210 [Micromonospora lutea]